MIIVNVIIRDRLLREGIVVSLLTLCDLSVIIRRRCGFTIILMRLLLKTC